MMEWAASSARLPRAGMLRVVVLVAAVSSASSCEAECERALLQSAYACCRRGRALLSCEPDVDTSRPAGRSGPPPLECPAGCQDNLDNIPSACECMIDVSTTPKKAALRFGCDDPTALSTGAIVGIVAAIVVVVVVVIVAYARLYDDEVAGLGNQTEPSSTMDPSTSAEEGNSHRPHASARAAPERRQAQAREEPYLDQADADRFIHAAHSGRLEDLQALYSSRVGLALLDCTNGAGGTTAMMWAAANGHADCLRALLDWGGTVDKVNSDGNTALHCASKRGALDCVQLLVERGADQSLRNMQGKTALEVAQKALLASGEQQLSTSASRALEKAFSPTRPVARQGNDGEAGDDEVVEPPAPLMAMPIAAAVDSGDSGSGLGFGAPEEPKRAPTTLEELAAVAQIGMGSISAFTEPDFDELTAGLGIDVGPRIVLRTQFRELKRGAEPEPELESADLLPPGSVP